MLEKAYALFEDVFGSLDDVQCLWGLEGNRKPLVLMAVALGAILLLSTRLKQVSSTADVAPATTSSDEEDD